jgi:hypothetical protein
MRRTARLSLVLAGCAALGLAVPAHAGSAPSVLTFSDPGGDSKLGPAGALLGTGDDITKVTWTTTGTTTSRRVGRKVVKTYTPKNAVVTIQTAGPIDTSGHTLYNVYATADGCGQFLYSVAPGTQMDSSYSYCTDDDSVDGGGVTTVVKANTISFTIPLKSVTGFVANKTLTSLSAFTGTCDPIGGLFCPTALAESTPLDNDTATTDAAFKIS